MKTKKVRKVPADAVQRKLLIADHEGLLGWSDKYSRGGPKGPVDMDPKVLETPTKKAC